jgi:hypothetical protein
VFWNFFFFFGLLALIRTEKNRRQKIKIKILTNMSTSGDLYVKKFMLPVII